MELRQITDQAELETTLAEGPFLLFKHSRICPVSARALVEYRAFLEGRPETLTGWIDVIEQRSLSQAVATSTGVRHESPQAILFVSDEVRWHASHGGITRASLAAAVGQDAAGSNA
jgi:bacillithiol system protein YtxJ